MKHRILIIIISITLLNTFINDQINAQHALINQTISNGIIKSSNNNHRVLGTLGQAVVGNSLNIDYKNSAGIWYNYSNIISNLNGLNDIIPLKYYLNQNYPNPFNPVTQIQFTVPKLSHITLEIFNVLGQRVSKLVDKQMEPGVHMVKFDAGNMASGFYIYRLFSKDFKSTKRMLLIK